MLLSPIPSNNPPKRVETAPPNKILTSLRKFFRMKGQSISTQDEGQIGRRLSEPPLITTHLSYTTLNGRHSFYELGQSTPWSSTPAQSLTEIGEIIPHTVLHYSQPYLFPSYRGPFLQRCTSQKFFAPTIIHRPTSHARGVFFDLHSTCNVSGISIAPGNLNLEFNPSLKTIEIVSDVKIYFETHFNNISASPNARSLRRRAMERGLEESIYTVAEKRSCRDAWRQKETEHLRNLRTNKITIADFEIIKIIGKGAFGCVKLAKLKKRIEINPNGLGTPSYGQADEPPEIICKSRVSSQSIQSTELEFSPINQVFALKVIPKAEHLKNGQEGHLRAERDFLVASEGSRWVVPLMASFQDDDNLYLAMEYMIGGDFLGLLIEKVTLSEEITRFYVAEMILCIEEAHRLSYIHRDIKPDNFCFSSTGHIKICDFGLAFSGHWTHDSAYFDHQRWGLLRRTGVSVEGDSIDKKGGNNITKLLGSWRCGEVPDSERILSWRNKNCKRRMAKSIVGTYQYMAPEILRGQLYDGRCDWWSLGVILYECLFGFTPFYADDPNEMKSNILNWSDHLDLENTPALSLEAKSLISSLICEKDSRLGTTTYNVNDTRGLPYSRSTQQRLGNKSPSFVFPNDSNEIKSHPFFLPINWKTLHLQTPPFVPEGLRNGEDTKYFSEYQLSSVVSTDAEPSWVPTGSRALATMKLPIPNSPKYVNRQEKRSDIERKQQAVDDEKGLRNPKINKRPKDPLLRDKEYGKELLKMRRKNAFKGYTYRRPSYIDLELKKWMP